MTFALNAVADPTNVPPRVTLTATESDPTLSIQTCDFFRNGVPVRFEAEITGDEAVAYDYDAEFDVPLVYRADAEEVLTAVGWTETWPNVSSWTAELGTFTASAGKATASANPAAPTVNMYRDAAAQIVRLIGSGSAPTVTIAAGTPASGSWVAVLRLRWIDVDTSTTVATLQFSRTRFTTGSDVQEIALSTATGGGVSVVHAPTTFDLTASDTSITAAGSGWTLTRPISGVPTRVEVEAFYNATDSLGSATFALDDIEVQVPSGDLFDVTATDTDTLSPTGATAGVWLTNSAIPEQAIRVEADPASSSDPYFIVTPATRASRTMAANTVALPIEGSPDVLTVSVGPRRYATWTLAIACTTEAAAVALEGLLANSAPINLRFPPTAKWERLRGGFYAVGDVEDALIGHPQLDPIVVFTLPLTPSRAPKFKPLWQWNYDTLAQTGMTYDDVAATFASYNDLLVGQN